ncbi:MAG: response regulator, partial [Planctomycetes bacterium]|nr:response regulator [Planctomycetota bacterium]
MARQSTGKRKGPKKARPVSESPKIVVVDDDPGVLRLLTRLLQKKYEVTAFSSPKEALKYLRAEQVDVIISDYMMAGMDGIQFIQKTLELAPDAKRIITTGFYDVETVVASINEAQIDFFLTKPINTDGLYQAVDKMWSNRLLQKERDLLAAQNHEMVMELKAFNAKLEGIVKERTTSLMTKR